MSDTGHLITVWVIPNGTMTWAVTTCDTVSVDPHVGQFTPKSKRGVILASLLTEDRKDPRIAPGAKHRQYRFPLDIYLDACADEKTYLRPFPQPMVWGVE